jgi:hypothetical protein
MTSPYARFLKPLSGALTALPPKARSVVFAFGGERLLPLYVDFSAMTSWGSPEVLRRSLNWVWSSAAESSCERVPSLLDDIAEATPHGDDFPTLAGLSAQGACIAVNSAVRELAGVGVGVEAIWYCFEPLRAAICDDLTGALDIGSGEEAEATEHLLVSDARMLHEMALYLKVVALVRDRPGVSAEVRALAERNQWSPITLRPDR